MEKSAKNEKSPWRKSRKKPGTKKKGKIGFSEDRKRDLAESDKGSWFDQETLVDVEGSVEGDHEELEQRPSTSSTVIGSSTQKLQATERTNSSSEEDDEDDERTDNKPGNKHWSIVDMAHRSQQRNLKRVCNAILLPRNSVPLLLTPWGPVARLARHVMRCHDLLWRLVFLANLYRAKTRT